MNTLYEDILTDGQRILANDSLSDRCVEQAIELSHFLCSSPISLTPSGDGMLFSTGDSLREVAFKNKKQTLRKNTIVVPPALSVEEYWAAPREKVFRTCVNTAKNPVEYGGLGVGCSYDWKSFHYALNPDKSEILQAIASSAILFNEESPEYINQLAEYVYNHPCQCTKTCQGRNIRCVDGGHFDNPLPILLPAPCYNIAFIAREDVFPHFVKACLKPLATMINNSYESAPNNIRTYLGFPESRCDPCFMDVRTTFECVLCCICKKTAAIASDAFTINAMSQDATKIDSDGTPMEVFLHPEQLWFNGFPKSVMQRTRDVKIIGPNVADIGYELPVISLILATHFIWKDGENRHILVCDTEKEPRCQTLKKLPETPNVYYP